MATQAQQKLKSQGIEDIEPTYSSPLLVPIGEFPEERLVNIHQRLVNEFGNLTANLRYTIWKDRAKHKFLYVTQDPVVAAKMYIAKAMRGSLFSEIDWVVRLKDSSGEYYLISREEHRPYFWIWWEESEFKTAMRSAFSDLSYDLAPIRQALPVAVKTGTIHDLDESNVTKLSKLHELMMSFHKETGLLLPPAGGILPLAYNGREMRLDVLKCLKPISKTVAERILNLLVTEPIKASYGFP